VTSIRVPALAAGGNPYISLLYAAVGAAGVSVEDADLHPWRLDSTEQGYDVLHMHWPEYTLAGPGAGLIHTTRAIAAALALRSSVLMLRSRGVRIVWTAHNLRPHNSAAPAAQVNLYGWFAKEADAVIVHTPYAGQLVRERLGRTGPMYLARHGNYIDAYDPPRVDRQTLRERYEFSETDDVLLAFGQISAYKRLPELVSEFESFASPSARLLIAGAPKDPLVAQKLKDMAAGSDRVVLLDRYIPDPEVGALYSLADLAVFNYSEIFSSGALLLAFTFGLAALAPRQGTDEILSRPALFAWEFSPFEVLQEALAVSSDVRRNAALEMAGRHGWDDAAQIHIRAYENARPNLP
jgi:beta-1,4-mannosyltransferase